MWTQVFVNLGGPWMIHLCLPLDPGGRRCSLPHTHTHTAVVTAAAVGDDDSVHTHLSAYLLFITLIFLLSL